jgi:inorganic pyrophosphatase
MAIHSRALREVMIMSSTGFLKEAEKFEIQAYKVPKDPRTLVKTHVPFSGSPRKHPYDSKKIILVADPYSSNTFYYEFRGEDIAYGQELPSITNIEGETITMVRIWVKKMSVGLRCTPFIVGDIEG